MMFRKGLSSIEHDKKMEALIQRDLLFPMGVTPKLVNVTVASRQPGEQRPTGLKSAVGHPK